MKTFASVVFVFYLIVFTAAEDDSVLNIFSHADLEISTSSVVRAGSWIRRMRNENFSWGAGNELALFALSLDPSWNASEPENVISFQQVDIDFLWQRIRDPEQQHFSWDQRVHLAQMLIAHCRNPSDYYGFDLLGNLLDVKSFADSFEYATKLLTVCSGNGNIHKSHVKKLMRLLDAKYWNTRRDVDSLSMVLIASGCVGNRYGYSSVIPYAADLPHILMKAQSRDGSFRANVISTALAVQALQVEGLNNIGVNKTIESAKKWLMSAQTSDGSFGDLMSTTEAMMALSSIGGRSHLHLGRCFLDQTVENATDSSTDADTVNFHLVLWIGQPVKEQHVLKLSAPVNTTVFQALTMAADLDENFKFEYRQYNFGPFITSFKNVTEDRMSSMGWLVYVLPTLDIHDDNSHFKGYQATKGVSQLPVEDGDNVLFWYKMIEQH